MSLKKFEHNGSFKCRKCKSRFTVEDLKEFVTDQRFMFYKCKCKKMNLISVREITASKQPT
jgi:transposase-like protein